MSITFNCEKCGKKIVAPDEAGGKRGRCPYCQASNYIPSLIKDEEIYDLATEDEADEQRRQKELELIRQQNRVLLSEMGNPELATGGSGPSVDMNQDLKPEELHPLIINFCLDMAGSKLDRAKTHLNELKKVKRMARSEVERFLKGDVLDPSLEAIPVKLRMGFLNQLKSALA
jgi:hypothetical protein